MLENLYKKRGEKMTEGKSQFYRVGDVAEMLEVSKPKAYTVIADLNKELKEMGKITIAGRINKRFFDEKLL